MRELLKGPRAPAKRKLTAVQAEQNRVRAMAYRASHLDEVRRKDRLRVAERTTLLKAYQLLTGEAR